MQHFRRCTACSRLSEKCVTKKFQRADEVSSEACAAGPQELSCKKREPLFACIPPSASSSPCKQAQRVRPIKASNDRDVQEAARDLKIGEAYCRAPRSAYLLVQLLIFY